MKGLDKFKKEIKAEVDKVKDEKRKKLIQAEADVIINHMESVCDEEYDDLLTQDHKSFRRMWKYVTKNAREYAIEGCAMVKDTMVFGWIDEYVGLDDKKETEEEEKERAKLEAIKAKATKTKTETKTETKAEPVQASIFDLM